MAMVNTQQGIEVRSVWSWNVKEEFKFIGSLVGCFPFVSIDTEFPGVIYSSTTQHPSRLTPEERYADMKKNVDTLNLIQVGITLSDANGHLPRSRAYGTSMIWEFNICDFDVNRDQYSLNSINLLISQGMNLDMIRTHGINSKVFAHHLLRRSSGLLCNPNITWVTFHSAYDFGYLAKALLRSNELPSSLDNFMQYIRVFFRGRIFDVKNIIRCCNGVYGGLETTASLLRIARIAGMAHHAGSDSLLIWQVFKRLREVYFATTDHGSLHRNDGVLYGLQVY